MNLTTNEMMNMHRPHSRGRELALMFLPQGQGGRQEGHVDMLLSLEALDLPAVALGFQSNARGEDPNEKRDRIEQIAMGIP